MTPQIPWQEIESVFLDLDGVLLDRYFDDYFWLELVPQRWQEKHGGELEQAQQKLRNTYQQVENTLAWYDLDYWSEQLQLNIPALKKEEEGRIRLRPDALDFLDSMQKLGKPLFLVTNAHPKTLSVKLEKYTLRPWFEQVVSTAEVGLAKEQPKFWEKLQHRIPYNRAATFFADDTEKVLLAAQKSGPHHLLHIAKPSSREAARYSSIFPSVAYLADVTRHVPK